MIEYLIWMLHQTHHWLVQSSSNEIYPYTNNITMTSVEDASNLEQKFRNVKLVRNLPGKPFPFNGKQFEGLVCSSVPEYIGDNETQKQFLHECIMAARKVYSTTPNKYFEA